MKKRYKRSIILLIIALILSFLSSACTRDQERRVEEETPKEEQREEVKSRPFPNSCIIIAMWLSCGGEGEKGDYVGNMLQGS